MGIASGSHSVKRISNLEPVHVRCMYDSHYINSIQFTDFCSSYVYLPRE